MILPYWITNHEPVQVILSHNTSIFASIAKQPKVYKFSQVSRGLCTETLGVSRQLCHDTGAETSRTKWCLGSTSYAKTVSIEGTCSPDVEPVFNMTSSTNRSAMFAEWFTTRLRKYSSVGIFPFVCLFVLPKVDVIGEGKHDEQDGEHAAKESVSATQLIDDRVRVQPSAYVNRARLMAYFVAQLKNCSKKIDKYFRQ